MCIQGAATQYFNGAQVVGYRAFKPVHGGVGYRYKPRLLRAQYRGNYIYAPSKSGYKTHDHPVAHEDYGFHAWANIVECRARRLQFELGAKVVLSGEVAVTTSITGDTVGYRGTRMEIVEFFLPKGTQPRGVVSHAKRVAQAFKKPFRRI